LTTDVITGSELLAFFSLVYSISQWDDVADVEMECLATWKLGAQRYAFGRLTGPGFSGGRLDTYRCVVSHAICMTATWT